MQKELLWCCGASSASKVLCTISLRYTLIPLLVSGVYVYISFHLKAILRFQLVYFSFCWKGKLFIFPHSTLMSKIESHAKVTEALCGFFFFVYSDPKNVLSKLFFMFCLHWHNCGNCFYHSGFAMWAQPSVNQYERALIFKWFDFS